MTTLELIQRLQQYPEDASIKISDNGYNISPVYRVQYDPDFNEIILE